MAGAPKCDRCGEVIVWAITEKNRRPIPIDPDPASTGNLVCAFTANDGKMVLRYAAPSVEVGVPRYIAHMATCPNPPPKAKGRKR